MSAVLECPVLRNNLAKLAQQGFPMAKQIFVNLLAFCLTALLVPPSWAVADDTRFATAAGGIEFEKSSDISMQEEVLKITPEEIDVSFRFLNETKKPISATLAFPFPITYVEHSNWENPDRLPLPIDVEDFKLWVDGQPLPTKRENRFELNGKNVAASLSEFGLNEVDPEALHLKIQKLSPDVKERLIREGLLVLDKHTYWHKRAWDIRALYLWEQQFPPGAIVQVRHTYRPYVGLNSISLPTIEEGEHTCFNFEFSKLIHAKLYSPKGLELFEWDSPGHSSSDNFSDEDVRPAHDVEYVLKTGANWKGPIRKFTLEVEGAAYVGACFEGDRFSARSSLRLQRENYLPTADVRVNFAGIGKVPCEVR